LGQRNPTSLNLIVRANFVVTLFSILPAVVAELEVALGAESRVDLAAQLRSATIERCTYEPTGEAGYIYLTRLQISAFAETWTSRDLNIDVDVGGRVIGIEVLDRNEVYLLLKDARLL
jgi:uncharacterized protein YuzE